jgi:hypothetical protein
MIVEISNCGHTFGIGAAAVTITQGLLLPNVTLAPPTARSVILTFS